MAKSGLERYRELKAKAIAAGIDVSDRPNMAELESRLGKSGKSSTKRKASAKKNASAGAGLQRYRDLMNEAERLGVKVSDRPKLATLERRIRNARNKGGTTTRRRSSNSSNSSAGIGNQMLYQRIMQRRQNREWWG